MKQWQPHIEQIGRNGNAYTYVSSGTVCMNNPTIVAGSDFAMLLDTTSHARTTSEFVAAMRGQIGRKPIRYTFITHPHGDHYKGHLAVPDSIVICTKKAAEKFSVLRERNKREPLVYRYENFSYKGGDSVPVPDMMFEQTLTVDLGGTTVQMIDCGHCHTPSDAIAFVPEEKVVVCGDILNNYVLADGNECNVKNWIETMNYISSLDAEWFVPGHGPVADRAEFMVCKEYLEFIWENACNAVRKGLSAEEAIMKLDLGQWENWLEPGRRVSLFDVAYRLCKGIDPAKEYPDWDVNKAIDAVRAAKGLGPANAALPTKMHPYFEIRDDSFDA